MEDFTPQEFRYILEADIHAAANFEIIDFAKMTASKAARLGESQKRVWLQNLLLELMDEPAYEWHINQTEVLSLNLDSMANNPNLLKAYQDADGSIDSFLESVPFIKSIVNGLLAAGKVDVVNQMLNNPGGYVSDFEKLFVDTAAAEKALMAAKEAGIIDVKGRWALGKRGGHKAIVHFWIVINSPEYGITNWNEDIVGACQVIAAKFGTSISKSTIYDYKDDKSGGYFDKVKRAITGN